MNEAIRKKSEMNFELLVRYYQRGTVVPFIGSGCSANICKEKFPQWRYFLLEYAEQLGIQREIVNIIDNVNIPFRYELAAATIAQHDATFTERIQAFFTLNESDVINPTALV